MSVDSGMGNYAGDADLEAIENETLPGTNNVQKIIGSLRQKLAQDNPTNTDTNINRVERVDAATPPKPQDPLELLGLGEGFSTPVDYTLPTSLSSVIRLADDMPATAPMMPNMQQNPSAASVTEPGAVPMDNPTSGVVTSSFNSIAYVIENGEVKCASCDNYYIPESEAHIKSAHCGFPGCPDAEGKVDYKKEGMEFIPNGNADNHFTLVASKLIEDADEGDFIRGKMIKTTDEDTKLASTDDYLSAFNKVASDSELYYRGYEDAKAGRPMDEDLAELSDDYFHGYDQFKFYNMNAQGSVPQNLYDIKPNSNNNPRMTQGEADLGLNELTDGHSFATASIDSLKEAANPLDFAHALQQTEDYKRQQRNNLLMNMALMTPQHQDAAETNKKLDAINCSICDKLGHTDDHESHAGAAGISPQNFSDTDLGNIAREQIFKQKRNQNLPSLRELFPAQPKGTFNSRKPGQFQMGKFTDTHQDLPIGMVSSKLPFPTDVIEGFFED